MARAEAAILEGRWRQQEDEHRPNGPAKSCAHGARRSQNMHADKTLDGREQGHDGRTVIGRGRQEKHTIEVAQHKGRHHRRAGRGPR